MKPDVLRPPGPAAAMSPSDASLLFKLVRLTSLTVRPFHDRVGREHQLSLNEWRVMSLLAQHPGLSAARLADLTGLDKMSISRALAGLDRRQRLLRHADPDDQRRQLLRLSPQGQALFQQILPLAREREAELFRGLSPTRRARFEKQLDELIEVLAPGDSTFTLP